MIRALAVVALLAAACGGGAEDEPTAAFSISWEFELADGTASDCATAGIDLVIAVADQGADFESVPSQFECSRYTAVTQQLPLGDYMIQLEQYQGGRYVSSTAKVSGMLDQEGTIDLGVPTFTLVVGQ